jgi:large subunit ribosomal protein L29
MDDHQLEVALHDRRHELFNLRFQGSMGALENTSRMQFARKEIARILTVQNERAKAKR